jgi:ABC-type Fe3+-citrate transport system substrate-binding protein
MTKIFTAATVAALALATAACGSDDKVTHNTSTTTVLDNGATATTNSVTTNTVD